MRDSGAVGAVFDDSYDYDQNGNVAAISDGLPGARGNRDMTYDGRDRLATASSPMFALPGQTSGTASFFYNEADSMSRMNMPGRDLQFQVDFRWRLSEVINATAGNQRTSYTYDARGNVSRRGSQEFVFDLGNRLREAKGLETYGYDASGRRTEARTATQGSILSFYSSDGVLRHQRDMRRGEATDFIYVGSRLVARVSRPFQVLPTPTLTVPETSTGAYTLSWTAHSAAARYELWEQVNGGSWTLVQSTAATSRAITGNAPGTYRYRVRLVTAVGTPGPYSVERSVVVTAPPPPTLAPTLSVPGTSTDGTFTVSWSTVSDASHYELQQQMNGSGWGGIGLTGSVNSWTSDRWGVGTYAYRARGCNATGCGPYSNIGSIVVDVPPSPTDAATISVPGSDTTGNYSVTWTPVPRAATYEVWERVNGGSWSLINQFMVGTSVYRQSQPSGSYTYRVRGCNANGCGPYSNMPSTVVELAAPPPSPSVSVPATSSTGNFTVSWTRPPGTVQMNVEESFEGNAFLPVLSNTTTTSVALTGRSNGQYRYRVNACNNHGCSAFAMAPNGIGVERIVLTSPTLTAPASSPSGSYTVSWTPVNGATAYELWEHGNGIGWSIVQSNASTSFNALGKAAGSYIYRVRPKLGEGVGPYSNQVTVTVGGQ
jgi:YD repeat-containing protein